MISKKEMMYQIVQLGCDVDDLLERVIKLEKKAEKKTTKKTTRSKK